MQMLSRPMINTEKFFQLGHVFFEFFLKCEFCIFIHFLSLELTILKCLFLWNMQPYHVGYQSKQKLIINSIKSWKDEIVFKLERKYRSISSYIIIIITKRIMINLAINRFFLLRTYSGENFIFIIATLGNENRKSTSPQFN